MATMAALACLTTLLQWHFFRDNLRGSALGMAIGWGQIAIIFIWMAFGGDAVVLPARAWLRMAVMVLCMSQITHNGGAWALLCKRVVRWIYVIGDRLRFRV